MSAWPKDADEHEDWHRERQAPLPWGGTVNATQARPQAAQDGVHVARISVSTNIRSVKDKAWIMAAKVASVFDDRYEVSNHRVSDHEVRIDIYTMKD